MILNIVCTVAIMVIFKYFDKYKVNNLVGITVNYLVCVIVGFLMLPEASGYFDAVSKDELPDWFIAASVMGMLFILLFNLIALSASRR